MALPDMIEEPRCDGMRDVCDKCAILLVENIFFLAREEKVGKSCADLIGDVGEVKLPLVSCPSRDDDLRKRGFERGIAESFAPGEAGLLVKRRGGQALQRKVFCERNVAEHGRVCVECASVGNAAWKALEFVI
jgi:hypothetical protein